MRAFTCGVCGQLLFFENSLCLRCSSPLGFVPSQLELVVVDDSAKRCANVGRAECNWIVEDYEALCRSCRLTRKRPPDDDDDGMRALAEAERWKRRLIFQLLDLPLAIGDDLAFDLLSSRYGPVVTGHENGVITLDLAESDDVRREQRRAELGEPYRELLGHFRHEIGHYYWPKLVEQAGELDRYRELFGDERTDYEEALQRHYEQGPPPDWDDRHVSAYATMHPWEDWAETFAHYLHIRDTLQTAAAYNMIISDPARGASVASALEDDADDEPFSAIIDEWLPLTYALNAVNRSMGKEDLYPFTLAPGVIEKLAFVDERVRAAGR